MSTIYRYTPEIETILPKAIQQALQLNVIELEKAQKGEFNHVFKVKTDKNIVIARVFRQANFPEDNKLQWIEDQFTKHSVPHAKLLYYTRNSDIFPHGFMISEYIEGKNGHVAIDDGDISFEEFHNKLAAVLNKVHQIKINKFGILKNGEGSIADFIDERIICVENALKLMQAIIKDDLFHRIKEKLTQDLNPFKVKYGPVLIHRDPSPDNSIYTPNGDIVLVDWDGAKASIWIYDLSWLTFFGSHMSNQGSRIERREKIIQSFLKHHDLGDFSLNEIEIIEKAFHISFAAELLQYFYLNTQNMKAYNEMIERLNLLLK